MIDMGRNRVVMEVHKINGHCPVYKKGDKLIIDPIPDEDVSNVNLPETDALCPRIFGTGLTSYFMYFEYAKPKPDEKEDLAWHKALGPTYFRCPEIGEPHSRSGYVIFKMYGVPIAETEKGKIRS